MHAQKKGSFYELRLNKVLTGVNRDKFCTFYFYLATSGEQKLNVLSYNPCLKTEFHICCSNLHKTILDFAKLCILPDFLPQPSNFFTRIYPPYP